MSRDMSVGLRVLAMLALAAVPELAICHLDGRALPPTVVCDAEGRLPDPTDCSFYMECTSNSYGNFTQTIIPCPEGTYYDPCQGDCSRTEPTPDCSVSCGYVGEPTVSLENPSIYFVCTANPSGRYIHVTMCDNGNAAGKSFGCNGGPSGCPVNIIPPPADPTCTRTYYYGDEKNCSVYYYCSGAGVPPDEGHCSPDQYFIPYNHSCIEFQCTSEGLFVDPANCSGYYHCSRKASNYVKAHYQCPTGSHFDSSVEGCMLGECTTVCPGGSSTPVSTAPPVASSEIQ